jgi:hypothetical protein
MLVSREKEKKKRKKKRKEEYRRLSAKNKKKNQKENMSYARQTGYGLRIAGLNNNNNIAKRQES